MEACGISADLVIGDFDSLKCRPRHANVIALSTEKDDTDTFAAIHEGLQADYSEFQIYCGTGGRIDHTLANIQALLYLAQCGKLGYLFDQNNVITAITAQAVTLSRCPPVTCPYCPALKKQRACTCGA